MLEPIFKGVSHLKDTDLDLLSWQVDHAVTEIPIIEVGRHGTGYWPIVIDEAALDNPRSLAAEEEIQRKIQNGYFDNALAWYVSFHPHCYDPSRPWGIYIRASAVEFLARKLRQGGVDKEPSIFVALKFLFDHEITHFKHEFISTHSELSASATFYLRDIWGLRKTTLGYGREIEGLCNSVALEEMQISHRPIFEKWLDSCPDGYRNWRSHKKNKRAQSWVNVFEECREANIALNPSTYRGGALALRELDGLFIPTRSQMSAFDLQVPVAIVPDGTGPNGNVAGAVFTQVSPTETAGFKKDILKSGNKKALERAWMKTLDQIEQGFLHNSRHLEKLAGFSQKVFSVRVEGAGIRGARAGLVFENDKWYAIALDQGHDILYERLRRMAPFNLND